jgi:hypothetical protein
MGAAAAPSAAEIAAADVAEAVTVSPEDAAAAIPESEGVLRLILILMDTPTLIAATTSVLIKDKITIFVDIFFICTHPYKMFFGFSSCIHHTGSLPEKSPQNCGKIPAFCYFDGFAPFWRRADGNGWRKCGKRAAISSKRHFPVELCRNHDRIVITGISQVT